MQMQKFYPDDIRFMLVFIAILIFLSVLKYYEGNNKFKCRCPLFFLPFAFDNGHGILDSR